MYQQKSMVRNTWSIEAFKIRWLWDRCTRSWTDGRTHTMTDHHMKKQKSTITFFISKNGAIIHSSPKPYPPAFHSLFKTLLQPVKDTGHMHSTKGNTPPLFHSPLRQNSLSIETPKQTSMHTSMIKRTTNTVVNNYSMRCKPHQRLSVLFVHYRKRYVQTA